MEKVLPENFSCEVGWYKAYVDLNGDVILCGGNLQTVVGNVYQERFRDIWEGQRAREMRMKLKHQFRPQEKFFRECWNCPFMIVDREGEFSGQMEWSHK